MSELDDRLHEARDAVSNMAPRADLWERVVERSSDTGTATISLHDRTTTRKHRSRGPMWFVVSVAACLLAVVAVVTILMSPDRRTVDANDPASAPTAATECPDNAEPPSITEGAQMKNRFVGPVVAAATAAVLFGGCGDDGPTTLASGEDIELVGDQDVAGQTLDISAEEDDGTVTGEIRFSDPGGEVVVDVECADTEDDGVVILGGTVTESTDDEIAGLAALFIRDGDPDSVAVWLDDGENTSCNNLLENRRDVLDDESLFVDVEAGSDIEIG